MVFLLFVTNRQFDEDLLKSFVHIIYTELFKAIVLKDFKTVDIEYADDIRVSRIGHRIIDFLHYIIKNSTVECFRQSVSNGIGLIRILRDLVLCRSCTSTLDVL